MNGSSQIDSLTAVVILRYMMPESLSRVLPNHVSESKSHFESSSVNNSPWSPSPASHSNKKQKAESTWLLEFILFVRVTIGYNGRLVNRIYSARLLQLLPGVPFTQTRLLWSIIRSGAVGRVTMGHERTNQPVTLENWLSRSFVGRSKKFE